MREKYWYQSKLVWIIPLILVIAVSIYAFYNIQDNLSECEKGNKDYVWENKTVITKLEAIIDYPYIKLKTKCINIPKINSIYIPSMEGDVTCEIKECRKKTDLELFKDELDSYDCEKLLLDMTEECDAIYILLNRKHSCEYNYYKETDEKLKDIFTLKNCGIIFSVNLKGLKTY